MRTSREWRAELERKAREANEKHGYHSPFTLTSQQMLNLLVDFVELETATQNVQEHKETL